MSGPFIDPRDSRTQPFTAAEFGNAWAVHRGQVFSTTDLLPFQREWNEWLAAHDAEVRAAALREAANDFQVTLHPYEGGVTGWLRDRADRIHGIDLAASPAHDEGESR